MATTRATRLRVGVVSDSRGLPAWGVRLVADIQASAFADAVLLVSVDKKGAVWVAQRVGHRVAGVLVRPFRGRPRARLSAVESSCGPPPTVHARATRLGPRGRSLGKHAIETIRLADLDVVVILGEPDLDRALSAEARNGAWRVPRPKDVIVAGGLIEVPLLWRAAPEASSDVIDRAVLSGDDVFPNRNRERAAGVIPSLVLRRLAALASEGFVTPHPSVPSGGVQSRPSASRLLARANSRRLGRRQRALWSVAYRRRNGRSVLEDLSGFVFLPPPPGGSFADPFVLTSCGRTWIFFENFPEGARKATISVAEIRIDGTTGPVETALEAPWHLSYPFVFELDGETYMIPESRAAGRVDIYRAEELPGKWERVRTLLDGIRAVDPTMLRWADRLWLFCGIESRWGSTSELLSLFVADSVGDSFAPHPLNPIVADVRSTRPAGTPFVHDGMLVRPAQDCSRGYGGAIVFNRIDIMDRTHYAETPFARLDPDWAPGLVATHTYSCDGTWEALDGKRRRSSS